MAEIYQCLIFFFTFQYQDKYIPLGKNLNQRLHVIQNNIYIYFEFTLVDNSDKYKSKLDIQITICSA